MTALYPVQRGDLGAIMLVTDSALCELRQKVTLHVQTAQVYINEIQCLQHG